MYSLITPPAAFPITLQEAKKACSVTHADDDAYIAALLDGATAYCDGLTGYLNRAIISQTWRRTQAGFTNARLIPPAVQSVSSVVYLDENDAEQTLSASEYRLISDGRQADIEFTGTMPVISARSDAVRIEFVAGYGDNPGDVPAGIRSALMHMVRHSYDEKEGIPEWAIKLLYPHRIHPL